MLSLPSDHITDLYVWVDDALPKQPANPRGGRPTVLSDSEVVTMLMWHTLSLRQQTLKDLYDAVRTYHRSEFPHLPTYQRFVAHCHRVLPDCLLLLQQLLQTNAPLRLMDSTMLPVCKLHRANSHKVAKIIADFGKNHQGWFYGFKLHVSIDRQGRLCGLVLTPASHSDTQQIPKLLNEYAKIAVGDTLYGARVMREHIWERYGTIIIAPPYPKQRQKLMAPWQHRLLRLRSKIESVFDVLKEHLHLVTSFARSIRGYLVHYVRILLAYQIMVLSAKN